MVEIDLVQTALTNSGMVQGIEIMPAPVSIKKKKARAA